MENGTLNPEDVVRQVHQEKLLEFIPVIVCLSVLSLVGIIGNVFTIGFYGVHSRRTPTVLMITALAVVDLLVVIILIHAIIEIAVNVFYTNRATCKIFHFAIHWAIAASALILGLISIDRYRRICQPLVKQISISLAKKLVIGVIALAFLLSIRDFVNFDIISFKLSRGSNTTDAIGHFCTTTDNPKLKASVTTFVYIDALLVIIVMATLIFTYGRIVWTICRHGSNAQDNVPQTETKSGENTDKDFGNLSPPPTTEGDTENKHGPNMAKAKGKLVKSNMKSSERNITLLMLIISVGFLICFVPYFTIKLGLRSIKRASDLELNAGTQFGIRLVYINSFLNPLVFCAFNPQFRRYVRNIVSKCRADPSQETESSSQVQLHPGRSATSTD